MSDAVIACCTWDACRSCAKYNETVGCTVPDSEFTVSYDVADTIVCDNFEEASDE